MRNDLGLGTQKAEVTNCPEPAGFRIYTRGVISPLLIFKQPQALSQRVYHPLFVAIRPCYSQFLALFHYLLSFSNKRLTQFNIAVK